ncbi:MAG: GntP family permease [Candidatus Sericytochromatia bacterium]
MLGVVGIVLSLILLIWLAYRGISVLILAPLLAVLAALFNGGVPLLASYTEVFMLHFANYAKAYFPLFLLGAIFGKVMDDSGCARAIAQGIAQKLGPARAVLAIVLACAVLTYGGVSLFVVAFAVFPIAAALFREADIPKALIPGTIALGSFTFTMTALPGSPQIQNAIPMTYFGTNTYAAPVIGLACGALMLVLGMLWLNFRVRRAAAAGRGYGAAESTPREQKGPLPAFGLALLPILLVLVLNFALSQYLLPQLDTGYLAQAPYSTTFAKVVGQWSLILAVGAGILATLALHRKTLPQPVESVNQGAVGSLLAVVNTSSEVGYGNVISSLPAFALIQSGLLGISSNPLVSEATSVSVLAGITGSASGGMSIALNIFGSTYLQMAQAANIDPQVLHRVATIACGSLDTLPHNGAVITLLAICGLSHRESYPDIGMIAVVIPLAATVLAVVLGSLGVV